MTLRCNNCGAPLAAPDDPALEYAACAYCQALTALPRRKQPRPAPVHEQRPVEVRVVKRAAAPAGSSIALLFGGFLLLVIGVAIFFQARPGGSLPDAARAPLITAAVLANGETEARVESDASVAAGKVATRSQAGTPTPRAAPTSAPSPKRSPASTPTASASTPPEPKPKSLRVSIGSPSITVGDYDKSIVKSRLAGLAGTFKACYADILEERPGTAGTLNVNFTIYRGQVRGAGARNPPVPTNLVACVNRTLYTLSFPASDDVVRVEFALGFAEGS